MKTAQEHQDFIDTLRKEQKVQLRNLQKEIRKAEADDYKRGIDEMLYRMNKSKGL
jgi:arginine deiminase